MSMDILSDLKETKKEIEETIRLIEKMRHKMGLIRERLREKGFTEKQLGDIQEVFNEV